MEKKEYVLNYFNNRSTNASTESFNSKMKDFRAQVRGVTDMSFFMYRMVTIFGEGLSIHGQSPLSPNFLRHFSSRKDKKALSTAIAEGKTLPHPYSVATSMPCVVHL